MPTRRITLCYRKLIDATATRPWDRLVLEESYKELRLQAQYYNQQQQYRTYAELLQHVPGADKLPFLVSGAVVGYLRQLNDTIPDIVNNLGRYFLRFTEFQFEIINSNLLDPGRHQIAINFFSEPLVWHDTIGNYLLVGAEDPTGPAEGLTHLFQLQPYLSIHSLRA